MVLATFEQMADSMLIGLTGATHLFDTMSQITVRESGVVGAILNNTTAVAGIIVDGHHVHPANVKMAFDLMGPERLIPVTDAIQTLAGMSDELGKIKQNYRASFTLLDDSLTARGVVVDGQYFAPKQKLALSHPRPTQENPLLIGIPTTLY